MDSTTSASKGVFVFKNNLKLFKSTYSKQSWYQTYSELWNSIEKKIENIRFEMSSSIANDLISFIKNSHKQKVTEIPTAALLTGVNTSDQADEFEILIKKLKQNENMHLACMHSEDGQNIKSMIKSMMNQFVHGTGYSSDEDDEFETKTKMKIKKVDYNFHGLKKWYDEQRRKKHFVVFISDFESFNEKVLHCFILIVSSYLKWLPFTFVFGIATSLTILHKTLPYHVSSKINVQVFTSKPSKVYLNNILENVFFTNDCPFHLGGNVFNLFIDTFLNYDLSVNGFIRKFKYAMLEHFGRSHVMTLCNKSKKVRGSIIDKFNSEGCERARRSFFSFRKLVENETPENQIKLLTDDDYFKSVLKAELEKNCKYMNAFHLFLKCLNILTRDLPENPLGVEIRELYAVATSKDVTETEEYAKCFDLLKFQSKVLLIEKVTKICECIEEEISRCNLNKTELGERLNTLYDLIEEGEDDGMEVVEEKSEEDLVEEMNKMKLHSNMDRNQFKRQLLNKATTKAPTKSELANSKLLKFISNTFKEYLYNPTKNYFHEIFFFYDISVEEQTIGAHRAALHVALKDPHVYLHCKCCEISNDSKILKSMPDICIAYKLHLEYGKMVNLYDWLQSFSSILNPITKDDEDEDKEVDPKIYARFTKSVAELEFLGFIKSSKTKTSHVQRLTWGG